MNHDPKEHYALFWDYENTPLSREDYYETYLALKAFEMHHHVVYGKVYFRQASISAEDVKILQLLPFLQQKIVSTNEKNAVDKILIQSCLSVIQSNLEISHILMLSGDGDFKPLLDQCKRLNKKFWVICQELTKNRAFVQQVLPAFSSVI